MQRRAAVYGRKHPQHQYRRRHDNDIIMAKGIGFDFASPEAWEIFYQENPSTVFEWHDSIPLELIANYVIREESSSDEVSSHKSSSTNNKCLIVGCGNSRLPNVIFESHHNCHMTLLDTSQACLEQLQEQFDEYDKNYHNTNRISYVQGMATELSRYFPTTNKKRGSSTDVDLLFDIIVDKGLTDALMCSEDWSSTVEQLLVESSQVLHPEKGQYLLVSYTLSPSTRQFLTEIGGQVGLEWEFELEGSNNRVMISKAQMMTGKRTQLEAKNLLPSRKKLS